MVCEPLMTACRRHRVASAPLYERMLRPCRVGEFKRCSPMAQRRTLNERRLTRRQVAELIATEARPRDDLTAALDLAVLAARVYSLSGDRFMLVFGGMSGLSGKGDIYAADVFHRFMRWSAKVDEDARHGRQSSTSHWAYYSPLKEQLTTNIDRLVAEL